MTFFGKFLSSYVLGKFVTLKNVEDLQTLAVPLTNYEVVCRNKLHKDENKF